MSLKQLSEDTLCLLALLVSHDVRFLIVGAAAVIYHGYARYTGDLDLYFDSSAENCAHLFAALREFWNGPVPGLQETRDLQERGIVVQFGVPPNRVDLMNSIDGLSFEEAYASSLRETIQRTGSDIPVRILSLPDLLTNKRASARPKDLDDVEHLS